MAKIKSCSAMFPAIRCPRGRQVDLKPVKSESFTLDSNLPYVLGFIAYRLPGTDSPGLRGREILADVLASQRGDLYGMVPAGKALAAEFGMAETYPKASVGYGWCAAGGRRRRRADRGDAQIISELRAERRAGGSGGGGHSQRSCAGRVSSATPFPGLANVWSNALAAEGRTSPDQDIDAIKKVTLADVNRVAKEYLADAASITATLKPVPSGEPVAAKGFGGARRGNFRAHQAGGAARMGGGRAGQLKVPANFIRGLRYHAAQRTAPDCARPIRPVPTVSRGRRGQAQSRSAKRRRARRRSPIILDGLFSYGTQTLDRLAFQKALDDIAANENAGYRFSLDVLKEHFSRACSCWPTTNCIRRCRPRLSWWSGSRRRSLSPAS